MGLCKCPKRKVTNLFCFEHRVNVCESCLLSNHESCVVQSYLSWLTDSDYDANCLLCFEPLNAKETIRLKCLHLFHWGCFDARARQLPETTAPAGYKCPSCLESIFPAENQSSPVVDKLKDKLQTVNWGRLGLGLPSMPELEHKALVAKVNEIRTNAVNHQNESNHSSSNHAHSPIENAMTMKAPMPIPAHEDPFEMNTFTARSKLLSDSNPSSNVFIGNEDDSKYVKKASTERSLRHRFTRLPRSVKRLLLALFCLFLLYIFYNTFFAGGHEGGGDTHEDPLFDPHANPNIKVQHKGREGGGES